MLLTERLIFVSHFPPVTRAQALKKTSEELMMQLGMSTLGVTHSTLARHGRIVETQNWKKMVSDTHGGWRITWVKKS